MSIRKLAILCMAICALLSVAVSATAQSTSRLITQKLVCQAPYDILDIVTNTTGSSPDYQIEADILETPGETVSWNPGAAPSNLLYIRKLGNGSTTPYYIGVTIQLSQFPTQWLAGQTLRLTITHVSSGQYAYHDITIPTGVTPVTIQDPVMLVPPFFLLDAPADLAVYLNADNTITLSWSSVFGADGYRIYASDDPYGGYSLMTDTTSNTYVYFGSLSKGFFKVIATSGRVESAPSDVVGFVRYECWPGNNFVAMPMVQDISTTSEFGIPYGEDIEAILIWSPLTQEWETSTNYGGGYWEPEIPVGTGSVLYFTSTASLTYYSIGGLPVTNAQYNIVAGNNTIMVPLNKSDLTTTGIVGYDISDNDIVSAIFTWSSASQEWVASINYGGDYWDPELPVAIGTPLFVSSSAEAVWPIGPRTIPPALGTTSK